MPMPDNGLISAIDFQPWDSEFFGFRVGKICDSVSPQCPAEILAALDHHAIRLLYWATPDIPDEALSNHRVISQLTFKKNSLTSCSIDAPAGYSVEPIVKDFACDELFQLAVIAGWQSRFRIDPRVGEDNFRRMYRIWIDRSCSGEIADAVMVARKRSTIAGVVTLSVRNSVCTVGLIAVSPLHHRRGLGRALMKSAENFAVSLACREVRVVTQSGNKNAIRLYTSEGYIQTRNMTWYHFWQDALDDS